MSTSLRNPRVWVGLFISAVAIYFAVRGISWAALLAALGGASYAWLVPATLGILVGQVARAVRWQVLFGDGPRPDLVPSFEILSIGYLVSAIFPLRLGDPARAWLIETRTPAGGGEALATVFVERAIDLLMIAALLAVLVPAPASGLLDAELGAGPWSVPANLSVITLALVAIVYAGLVIASEVGPIAGRATTAVLARVGASDHLAGRAGALVAGFGAGFAPLRRPRTAVKAAAWTLAVWLIGGFVYWLVMEAFHLDLPFAAAIFTLGATALFAILPSSPGYVGVFHSAIVLALASFAGVPKEIALAYAIVLHGLTIAILIGLGVASLWALGLSRRDLGARLSGGASTV